MTEIAFSIEILVMRIKRKAWDNPKPFDVNPVKLE